jgi:hypothetical protein
VAHHIRMERIGPPSLQHLERYSYLVLLSPPLEVPSDHLYLDRIVS